MIVAEAQQASGRAANPYAGYGAPVPPDAFVGRVAELCSVRQRVFETPEGASAP